MQSLDFGKSQFLCYPMSGKVGPSLPQGGGWTGAGLTALGRGGVGAPLSEKEDFSFPGFLC